MEGFFVMTMLVDMRDCKESLENVRAELEQLGEQMELQIQIQHENIFKMMHRV